MVWRQEQMRRRQPAWCRLPPIVLWFYDYPLSESIIDEQEDAQDIERRIQIPELTHHHLDQYIAQDAEADAIGDAVTEPHRNHCNEGWERLGNILQLNLLERINHQYTHHYQGTTGGCTRNQEEDWSQENAQNKHQAHKERCQARLTALGNTRSTLHISGNGRDAVRGTGIQLSENWVTPIGIPINVEMMMAINKEPFTLLAIRQPQIRMLMRPRMLTGVNLPSCTKVSALAVMMPAFFKPIKAINIPIPAEMANRRFFGIHSNILSRILRKVMARKMIPSTSNTAKACCQVYPIAWQRVKAKKAFSPMLGAWAKGSFAMKASRKVAMAEVMAVAVKRAPLSMPVVARMVGFTAKM